MLRPLSFYFPSVSNSSLNPNAKVFVPDGSLYSHTLNPRARLFIPGISHTDINSDARNISLNPRAHVFVSRVCVSEYSALNVNAKDFIPFSTLMKVLMLFGEFLVLFGENIIKQKI